MICELLAKPVALIYSAQCSLDSGAHARIFTHSAWTHRTCIGISLVFRVRSCRCANALLGVYFTDPAATRTTVPVWNVVFDPRCAGKVGAVVSRNGLVSVLGRTVSIIESMANQRVQFQQCCVLLGFSWMFAVSTSNGDIPLKPIANMFSHQSQQVHLLGPHWLSAPRVAVHDDCSNGVLGLVQRVCCQSDCSAVGLCTAATSNAEDGC